MRMVLKLALLIDYFTLYSGHNSKTPHVVCSFLFDSQTLNSLEKNAQIPNFDSGYKFSDIKLERPVLRIRILEMFLHNSPAESQ